MERIIRCFKSVLIILLSALLCIPSSLSVFAENEGNAEIPGIPATHIYTYESTIYIHRGERHQLSYRLSPADSDEKPVWSISYGSNSDSSNIVVGKNS